MSSELAGKRRTRFARVELSELSGCVGGRPRGLSCWPRWNTATWPTPTEPALCSAGHVSGFKPASSSPASLWKLARLEAPAQRLLFLLKLELNISINISISPAEVVPEKLTSLSGCENEPVIELANLAELPLWLWLRPKAKCNNWPAEPNSV